jgi:hypothetical protein
MVDQDQWGREEAGGVMIRQGLSPMARGMVPACMVVSGNNWARG